MASRQAGKKVAPRNRAGQSAVQQVAAVATESEFDQSAAGATGSNATAHDLPPPEPVAWRSERLKIAVELVKAFAMRAKVGEPNVRKGVVSIAVEMADALMLANMNKATPTWVVEEEVKL